MSFRQVTCECMPFPQEGLTASLTENVIVAEFEADSYMAAQIIHQITVMVMTKDSDIPIIAGDNCISIISFMKSKFESVCTSEAILKHAMSYLPDLSKEKVQFKPAVSLLFEGISNVHLFAPIMLMLGCDVYIPGMKAVKGMSTMKTALSEWRTCEDESYTCCA
jgi:hypothetical protein